MKNICRQWGFWNGSDDESKAQGEEGDDREKVIGGVSMLSHSNGSVGHAWSEYLIISHLTFDVNPGTSIKRLSKFNKKKYIR